MARRSCTRRVGLPGRILGGSAGGLLALALLLLPAAASALADGAPPPDPRHLPAPKSRRIGPGAAPGRAPAPRPGPAPAPVPAPAPAPASGTSSAREVVAPAAPAPGAHAAPPGPAAGPAPGPAPSIAPPAPPAPPGPPAPMPPAPVAADAAAARAAPPGGRAPARRPTVVRIEFQGNDLFATPSLKALMAMKEGSPFDEALLDRDMALLARYFESAHVVQQDVAGGVALTFVVRENPLVVDVVVRGAADMKEEEVRAMLRTKAGYPLFPHLLAADAADVANAYRQRGFAFAQVPAPLVTTPPEGGRRVEFTVVEGPKVEVERIVFQGAHSIARKDLLEVMQTKARDFWSFLSGPVFREDVLREDVVALTRLYQDEGFLDAEVALADLRFSDDKERAQITIAVEEHQPYTVGTVTVKLVRPDPGHAGSCPAEDTAYLTEERLAGWLGVKPGERWNGKRAAKGRERIREELYRRSYLEARVGEPEWRGREHELVADVVVPVTLGWKFRLRRIDFVGNEFTRDSYLRQEVRVVPGGYVDRNDLERAQARLKRTGYFARVGMDVVDVPSAGEDREGAWKDARYEIVEQKTGKLSFQVGLSTSGGLFGSIAFQKRNFDIARLPRSWSDLVGGRAFTGNGQTFDAVISPGTETTSFVVGFTEPRFLGTDVSFQVRLYDRIEGREQYDLTRLGYQVSLAYPFLQASDDTLLATAGLRWRHEGIDVHDLDLDAVPGAYLFQGHNELHALRGYLTLRTLDDVRRARRQLDASLAAELAGTFLGGEVSDVKIEGEATQVWALSEDAEGRRQKLTARARLGWARALEDTPEVPPFERYLVGGNEFRGFRRRGVGPHIGGNPTGGEWLLMGTLEFEQPLFGDTISGVIFSDFGTLGTSLAEDDAWRLRWTVGPGLRLHVPALGPNPLAFDFGFVIVDEAEDERQLFTFSIARDF